MIIQKMVSRFDFRLALVTFLVQICAFHHQQQYQQCQASAASGSNVPFKTSFVSSSDYSIRRNGALISMPLANSETNQVSETLMVGSGFEPSVEEQNFAFPRNQRFSFGEQNQLGAGQQSSHEQHGDDLLAASSSAETSSGSLDQVTSPELGSSGQPQTQTSTTASSSSEASPSTAATSTSSTPTTTASNTTSTTTTTTSASTAGNATQASIMTVTIDQQPLIHSSSNTTTIVRPPEDPTTTMQSIADSSTTSGTTSAPLTSTPLPQPTSTVVATVMAAKTTQTQVTSQATSTLSLPTRTTMSTQIATSSPTTARSTTPAIAATTTRVPTTTTTTTTTTTSSPTEQVDNIGEPVFASNRSSTARSLCNSSSGTCSYLVATVPAVESWPHKANQTNQTTTTSRLVNEFVFLPADSSAPLTFESDPLTSGYFSKSATKRPLSSSVVPTSELKAEHRTIETDASELGEDLELDYISSADPDEHQRGSTATPTLQQQFNNEPSTTSKAPPQSPAQEQNPSSTTQISPIKTTMAAATTTTTTTPITTVKLPFSSQSSSRTSQSTSFTIRVLPQTLMSHSSIATSNNNKPAQISARLNQKLMRPIELTAATTTTTTTSTTRRPTKHQATQRLGSDLAQGRHKPASGGGGQHRMFFNEPVRDLRRRPTTIATGNRFNAGGSTSADDEEANILTRYTIGSQLARLSALTANSAESSAKRSAWSTARSTPTSTTTATLSTSTATIAPVAVGQQQNRARAANQTRQLAIDQQQKADERRTSPSSKQQLEQFEEQSDRRRTGIEQQLDQFNTEIQRQRANQSSSQQQELRRVSAVRQVAANSAIITSQQQQQVNVTTTTMQTTTFAAPAPASVKQVPTANATSSSANRQLELAPISSGPNAKREVVKQQQQAQQLVHQEELMTLIASSAPTAEHAAPELQAMPNSLPQLSPSSSSSQPRPSSLVVIVDSESGKLALTSGTTTSTTTTSKPTVSLQQQLRSIDPGRRDSAPARGRPSEGANNKPRRLVLASGTTVAVAPEELLDEYEGSIEDQLAKDALHSSLGLASMGDRATSGNAYSSSRLRGPAGSSGSSGSGRRRQQQKQKPVDNGQWQPSAEDQALASGASETNGSGVGNLLPGRPGIDYPIHWQVPKTSFDCRDYEQSGFYADQESDCQAYHSCHRGRGGRHTFLCPNGTLFSQELLTCDWWYNVECAASKLHLTSSEQQRQGGNGNSNNIPANNLDLTVRDSSVGGDSAEELLMVS